MENVVKLIDEGNTIPFIARYRKELHGAMDDTALRTLADRLQYLRNLENAEARSRPLSTGRESSLRLSPPPLTPRPPWLRWRTCTVPYKQKRRTRATVARERVWSPWPRSCSPRAGTARAASWPPAMWTPKKGWRPEQAPRAPPTSWPSRSLTTPPCVSGCGRCGGPRGPDLHRRKKDQGDSVHRLYYDFKTPVNRAQGHSGAGHQPG